MAARAAQEAQVLTPEQALAFVERHGVVCESARRGLIPALADAVAGETLRGNWWPHPKSREIFAITRAVRKAPQILVCKIVDGKVSFVHERLWTALVRLAEQFPRTGLARVREVHTESGKHVLEETAFPDWVPLSVVADAKRLTEREAMETLRLL